MIDGAGEIRARGARSYEFDYEQPDATRTSRLAQAEGLRDHRGLGQRRVPRADPAADLRRPATSTSPATWTARSCRCSTRRRRRCALYRQLEDERGRLLFEFGLLYLGFAADPDPRRGLARPVVRRAAVASPWAGCLGASQRVGAGDLDVRGHRGGRRRRDRRRSAAHFNQMTRQLKAQRETLLETDRADRAAAAALRLGAVLGHVGRRRARPGRARHLRQPLGRSGSCAVRATARPSRPRRRGPRVRGAVRAACARRGARRCRSRCPVTRSGAAGDACWSACRRAATDDGTLEGYVVAFDDVTDLVTAQRMAAWGDVARRIAHEIKNPLTPIQLSAERIKRKFRDAARRASADEPRPDDRRHRPPDRGPAPHRRRVLQVRADARARAAPPATCAALVRDAVTLQEAAQQGVAISMTVLPRTCRSRWTSTRRMIAQALTNLIKNAGEAIESRQRDGRRRASRPRIEVTLASDGRRRRDHHRGQRHRPAARPGAALRALRHDARQGHRPRPAHRARRSSRNTAGRSASPTRPTGGDGHRGASRRDPSCPTKARAEHRSRQQKHRQEGR